MNLEMKNVLESQLRLFKGTLIYKKNPQLQHCPKPKGKEQGQNEGDATEQGSVDWKLNVF